MGTMFFSHQGKQLAFEDSGQGEVVLLVPGLGDLKETYRHLVPGLVAAGYRTVCLDLRGHGESDAGWDDYSVEAVGGDVVALVRHLGVERVHYVGNSMAAGAGIWAATEEPGLFCSLTFIGPFYSGKTPWAVRALLGPLFWKPWGVAAWVRYYSSLYPTRKPADFAAYTARMATLLGRPGHLEATKAMMFASKEASGARVPRLATPTLVLLGSRDPDFRAPASDLVRIAGELKAASTLVEGAGHYPQAEFPGETLGLLVPFWKGLQP